MKQRLMNIAEASEYIKMSPNYIRSLILSGEIPFINISKGEKACYRFDRVALDKWIETLPGMDIEELQN